MPFYTQNTIKIISISSMSSPPILDEIQVITSYDDKSFLDERHSRRIWPDDSTRATVFPAEEDQGTSFEPFQVETREFHINTLPPTPLKLFQLFLPISLVEKWVVYTKIWVSWLKMNGWIDSWKTEMKRTSKLHKWEGPTASEVMTTIAVLIYMGVHKERAYEAIGRAPSPVLNALSTHLLSSSHTITFSLSTGAFAPLTTPKLTRLHHF
jgi:hypothetical protein